MDGVKRIDIAIFGKSHEIWPVAGLLAKELSHHIELTIVEEAGSSQPAALTLPCKNRFHDRIGLEARDLIKYCNGTFGLATELLDWHDDDSSFFTAASGKLPQINGIDLHQAMLRAALDHGQPDRFSYLFQPFRFAARAASEGKFAFPSDDSISPTALLGPTVQLDRSQYTALIKSKFETSISHLFKGVPSSIGIEPETGKVSSVKLDDGETITAEMFIDVSGTLSSFIPTNLESAVEPLSEQLPFNWLVSCTDENSNFGEHGQTRVRTMPAGILFETPLGEGTISEFLFSAEDMDERNLIALVGENSKISEFRPGYCDQPWTENLVRMGSAAGQLGPYQSSEMILLHEQASLLAAHIPTGTNTSIEAAAYNHLHNGWAEEIRDFMLLPLKLNNRRENIWCQTRESRAPETLSMRLDQFHSRARFVPYENELFDEQTWIDLFVAMAPTPRRYDPIAQKLDMSQTQRILKQLADDFNRAIGGIPSHFDFMQEYQD